MGADVVPQSDRIEVAVVAGVHGRAHPGRHAWFVENPFEHPRQGIGGRRVSTQKQVHHLIAQLPVGGCVSLIGIDQRRQHVGTLVQGRCPAAPCNFRENRLVCPVQVTSEPLQRTHPAEPRYEKQRVRIGEGRQYFPQLGQPRRFGRAEEDIQR